MKIDCDKCDGEGEKECSECGHCKDCYQCDGTGKVVVCFSEHPVPKGEKWTDEVSQLQQDAIKCKSDRDKLIALNPRATESYNRQFATVLEGLNLQADRLMA